MGIASSNCDIIYICNLFSHQQLSHMSSTSIMNYISLYENNKRVNAEKYWSSFFENGSIKDQA